MNVAKKQEQITPVQFEAMDKDERFNYELIDGIVLMSPSPSREHQSIASNLHYSLKNKLLNLECEVLFELDIKFNDCIYRPDLMVFCNKGAELPEIIFEILSPSSRQRDLFVKLNKYHEMGIKEYWIVDPKSKTIIVHDFVFETAEIYTVEETIHSCNLPEIIIKVADIFA